MLWDSRKDSTRYRVLNLAANIIEAEGWCQASTAHRTGTRGYCLVIAVYAAAKRVGISVDSEWFKVLRQIVGGCPVDWNNAFGRTKEEVVGVLRKASC
jgi:hypothetical protein